MKIWGGLFWLFALLGARADMVLVQSVQNNGKTGELTLKIKGERTRLDLPMMELSVIADANSVITLQHASKSYTRVGAEQLRLLAQKTATAAQSDCRNVPRETGVRENVGQYSCTVYTAETGNIKWRYWISKDYPNAQEILSYLGKLAEARCTALVDPLVPRPAELPGLPLKVEQAYKKIKITATLISAQQEELSGMDFEPPADYTESPTPKFDFSNE